MKNKLGFALCLLLVAVFMGCKEDEEGKHHFSNQVFISATSFTDDVFIKRDNLDVTREESCDVTVAMAQPRERDITVTFAEAPGLLEHYRMFYDDPTAELLPANGAITISRIIRLSSRPGWWRVRRSPSPLRIWTICPSRRSSVMCCPYASCRPTA